MKTEPAVDTTARPSLAALPLPAEMSAALLAAAQSAAPYTRAAGYDADDLVAEGFLCAERALASYDAARGVPLDVYFGKVVLRRRFIQLGRSKRLQTCDDVEALRRPPHRAEELEQLRREVRDVIACLLRDDPLRRTKATAFALYFLAGYKLRELSAHFGASVTTVHKWIEQAKADFRRLWLQGEREGQARS